MWRGHGCVRWCSTRRTRVGALSSGGSCSGSSTDLATSRRQPGADDPAGRDWLNLRADDGTAYVAIQQVAALAPSTWPEDDVPQQLHLDLSVPDNDALDGAHAFVLQLGGTLRLDRSDDEEEPVRVYADPDGHPVLHIRLEDLSRTDQHGRPTLQAVGRYGARRWRGRVTGGHSGRSEGERCRGRGSPVVRNLQRT